MVLEEDEYNGHPIVKIKSGENPYPFQFGLKKAILILEHIDEIKDFVIRNS